MIIGLAVGIPILIIAYFIFVVPSIRIIGPTQVGLVTKRFGAKKLSPDNPIAFNGEAGYQADLLMPGWRWKLWVRFSVEKHPWVQVPAGEIGVVIAQVGKALPIGAKSAKYTSDASIKDVSDFVNNGGQKGVQRPVLPPGTLIPLHPIAFLVITREKVYGKPVSPELMEKYHKRLGPGDFGLDPNLLKVTLISPSPKEGGKIVDMIGIVTIHEGDPLPPGDIAGRIGGFSDIADAVKDENKSNSDLIELIIGAKNVKHNNYQDLQGFLDSGGKIGLQHDPLLYGAYNLNPFLVKVEKVPMLVVEQGEVAVIKSYVGLAEGTGKVNAEEFKFGTIVRPGHRGIWCEPLRTGKYAINPHCYQAEIVPVSIITLNWADASLKAYEWEQLLKPIDAKSREGFVFHIDLQVQIHIAAGEAPAVISMVGTMQNLTTQVLQPAVGNHFRDKLQSMPAVRFIETRQEVQREAQDHVAGELNKYHVETRGVYIQNVILPDQLVQVLTDREIANQQVETYKKQKDAQAQRVDMEQMKGTADKQAELATAKVGVDIKRYNADARKKEADGEAYYISETGKAQGAQVEAVGLAKAKAYEEQIKALGKEGTTLVNVITALADKSLKFVPEVVSGDSGSGIAGLIGALTNKIISEQKGKS
jgi:regulator of protease activity HflC (stomatin/prohibitin superfamily)